MKASELDFSKFKYLSANEWPKGALEKMDAKVILLMNKLRELNPNFSMTPSPIYNAHVRDIVGNSRHCTNKGARLSDATDFFMKWDVFSEFVKQAQRVPELGGFGIYFDTHISSKSRPMVHIDCRPNRVMWVRHKPDPKKGSVYVYKSSAPEEFDRLIKSINSRG